MAWRILLTWWAARLFITTPSLGLIVGRRDCWTQARKISLLKNPSITMGANSQSSTDRLLCGLTFLPLQWLAPFFSVRLTFLLFSIIPLTHQGYLSIIFSNAHLTFCITRWYILMSSITIGLVSSSLDSYQFWTIRFSPILNSSTFKFNYIFFNFQPPLWNKTPATVASSV